MNLQYLGCCRKRTPDVTCIFFPVIATSTSKIDITRDWEWLEGHIIQTLGEPYIQQKAGINTTYGQNDQAHSDTVHVYYM